MKFSKKVYFVGFYCDPYDFGFLSYYLIVRYHGRFYEFHVSMDFYKKYYYLKPDDFIKLELYYNSTLSCCKIKFLKKGEIKNGC